MLKNIPINSKIILKSLVSFLLFALSVVLFIWVYQHYLFFASNSGALADYQLLKSIKIKPVNGQKIRQSSGLTYNNKTNQLYLIENEPPQILIFSEQGDYQKTIVLNGFDDTEGIAYLGNNQFVVTLEDAALIAWFELKPDTTQIQFNPQQTLKLANKPFGNTGIEGIAYAKSLKQLFIVKERRPKRIYRINWALNHHPIDEPWNPEYPLPIFTRSFSGIYFDPKTNHLFILSRRSLRIIEYTLTGEEVGSFALKSGSGLLTHAIKHAEGITISDNGTLYICAEPNDLYIFRKK